MKKRRVLLIMLIFVALQTQAQEISTSQPADSLQQRATVQQDTLRTLQQHDRIRLTPDTVGQAQPADTILGTKEFKPSPKMAVILAAAFPGLGQVYNRKYWKLPILYGGFVGFSYAISWNQNYYKFYFESYKSIVDDDPNTNYWHKALPYGQDPATADQTWLKDVFKKRKDFYRRYRDLSIIGTVALYGLSIVDAYVDAQLFDFDISPDLSMRIEPTVIQRDTYYTSNAFGIQCSFNFK